MYGKRTSTQGLLKKLNSYVDRRESIVLFMRLCETI